MRDEIITADSLEWMRSPPDGLEVDAIITDPPYCSGAVSESRRTAAKAQGVTRDAEDGALQRFGWFTGDNMGTAGLCWTLRTMAVLSRAIVRESGSLLCFLDWRMAPNVIPTIESAGLRYQNLVVWDKGSLGLGTGFRATHELIAHFTYGAPVYHSVAFGNVIRCRRVPMAARRHPTEKPAELLEALVRVVAPRGGTVLDPFAGSGSLGDVAFGLGVKFIGIDWKDITSSPPGLEPAAEELEDDGRARQSFLELDI